MWLKERNTVEQAGIQTYNTDGFVFIFFSFFSKYPSELKNSTMYVRISRIDMIKRLDKEDIYYRKLNIFGFE